MVGLTRPVDDTVNGRLYDAPLQINVLRAFPGFGIQLWGARTLSPDTWLRFVMVSAVSSEASGAAQQQIESLLRDRHHIRPGQDDDFSVRNLKDIADQQARTVVEAQHRCVAGGCDVRHFITDMAERFARHVLESAGEKIIQI